MIVFFLITSPFLVLFFFLLVLKLTETIAIWWDIVFIPIWLLFFAWAMYIIYIMWKRSRETRQDNTWRWDISFQIISFLLLLAFSIPVNVILDMGDSGTLTSASIVGSFVPLWIYLIFIAIYSLGLQLRICSSMDYRCIRCSRSCMSLLTFFGVVMWLSFVTFTILLVVKLANDGSMQWDIVFIPVWVGLTVWFFYIIYVVYCKFTYRTSDEYHYKSIELIFQTLAFLAAFYFLVLLNIELQTPGTIGITSLFLPLIIFLLVVFIFAYILDYRADVQNKNTTVFGRDNINYVEMAEEIDASRLDD